MYVFVIASFSLVVRVSSASLKLSPFLTEENELYYEKDEFNNLNINKGLKEALPTKNTNKENPKVGDALQLHLLSQKKKKDESETKSSEKQ